MSFKTELITKRDMTKDFCWILQEPLIYENDKYIITVKAGFDFDFASIPWLLRRVLPKNGKSYDRASCVHDALYAAQALPKSNCDDVFFEAMIDDRTSVYLADAMYSAVWIGGASAYNTTEELEKYKNLVVVVEKHPQPLLVL